MKSWYASPLRVYCLLAGLALAGLVCLSRLPVGLYPNSAKPVVAVQAAYGSLTATEFMDQYGNELEGRLRTIASERLEVEKTQALYDPTRLEIKVEFKWGAEPKAALREVEAVVHAFSPQLPEELRDQLYAYLWGRDSGFFLASFFSSKQNLEELYQRLEPVLMAELNQVRDALPASLWNPAAKEVRIELFAEKMANFQLMPHDIERAVRAALQSWNGGALTVAGKQLTIQLPKAVTSVKQLADLVILTPSASQQLIHLSDVARVTFDLQRDQGWSYRTGGAPSLILMLQPRPGGNIKRMSEEVKAALERTMSYFSTTSGAEYKVLVDPSLFIRAAVFNVLQEVAVGSFLAVLVLFLFMGSFKNIVTAAIEIPLSMVLAFIPMKLSGMSLNLISLGGLALSAGMNVDASVVVMENIFRHFEQVRDKAGGSAVSLSAAAKLRVVMQAVNEVKLPVLASTLASVVVFLPLLFSSGLSYAILGDLAKTVVFSHSFSALVALILVPTVRLQLLSWESKSQSTHGAPADRLIHVLEASYVRGLKGFLHHPRLQMGSYLTLSLLLAAMLWGLLPRLPQEVIGKPDTEDLMVGIETQGHTALVQIEEVSAELEKKIFAQLGQEFDSSLVYCYSPNACQLMLHLKDKAKMRQVQKAMQDFLPNTPSVSFNIFPSNPAELPIPHPPEMQLALQGGSLAERAEWLADLRQEFASQHVYPSLWTRPSVAKSEQVELKAHWDLWSNLRKQGVSHGPQDLADMLRVLTGAKRVGEMTVDHAKRSIFLSHPASRTEMSVDALAALPLGVSDLLIPLKALAQVQVVPGGVSFYRENQRDRFLLFGRSSEGDSSTLKAERLAKAKQLVLAWQEKQNALQQNGSGLVRGASVSGPAASPLLVSFEDAGQDVHEAMDQLFWAVVLSVVLMFFILLMQFGDLVDALLVLVAIPLGLLGVLVSLFVFQSTLSLNSLLGVILLNGIAVANSIILVDFIRLQVQQGLTPVDAALAAAKKRLRPILITSLTTVLGMLPVALGLGQGGRILQPLGIAVSGGLGVSMGLTLFIVPALQVRYLQSRQRRWQQQQQVAVTYGS